MQANTDELLTRADFMAFAEGWLKTDRDKILEELQAIKEEVRSIKDSKPSPFKNGGLRNAKEVASYLNIHEKIARKYIAMPKFPQSTHGKRKKYKTGPWLIS